MNLSIARKVNILSLGTIIVFGLIVAYVFIKQEKNTLNVELDDRTRVLLDSLKVSCEYPIMIGDTESLKKITDSVLAEKDVIACRVEGKDGKLLYKNGDENFQGMQKVYDQNVEVLKQGKSGFDDMMLGSSMKSEKEKIGRISMVLSLERENQKIKDVTRSILILIIMTIVFASLASSVLFKVILSDPIKELVTGTQKIALGDLNFKVTVKTHDEIGKLGQAFNKMTDDLQRVTVSRNYVDSIINTMNDTLLVLNSDRTLRTVNDAVLRLLGYTQEDLIGKPAGILFSQDIALFKDKEWEELLKNGSVSDYDINYVTKAGENIPASFSGSVMVDKKTNTVSFVGIARDMREMLKLKRQLFQTEKMAAVGQLAGGVAHEINNPMSVILGFAQTVSRRITDESNPLYMPLKSIEREALRCKKLVGDLLTFSRVSKTENEYIDLSELMDETVSLIESKCRVKDVELKRDIPNDIQKILANKNQIQQVIVNLCNNALDAMDKGGILTISARVEDNLMKIRVADTGKGIPPEIQERIFEPFFTTKEVGKGTGLGLSISYEIIQKHNGTIDVESQIGKGTTFIISLPIKSQNV
jgi:PAS domain S-box-containing protein